MEDFFMNRLDKSATKGEIDFVEVIALLAEDYPERYKLYYEPNGTNTYPDFALYSRNHGIILFEIKDQSIDYVKTFNQNEVVVTYANYKEHSLPLHKQLTYQYKAEFDAINENIPISELFVFSNLSEKDVRTKFRFDTSKKNRFLFKEDLVIPENFSRKIKENQIFKFIENPKSRGAAIRTISGILPESVVQKELNSCIQPVLFEELYQKENILLTLTNEQEARYRNFIDKPGYRFMKGHAGTGKTVLLQMRAEHLAKKHPDIKILITYYTTQLDGVYARLEKDYPNITAQRFAKFCNQKIKHENNIGNQWERYFIDCLDLLSNPGHNYSNYFDYILIDEGQDFSPIQGSIIEKLAKGTNYRNKQILVAFDDFQALNRKGVIDTPQTFKGKKRGRVTVLRSSIRTPKQIAERAQRLIGEEICCTRDVENAFKHYHLKNDKTPIDLINQIIPQARERDIELKDIAIIYPNYRYIYQKVNAMLENLQIPHVKYESNKEDRKILESKKVKVLSSTYSKGLEFKLVFLIYFDEAPEEIVDKYKPEEHLYVSMTRATHYLRIISKSDNKLIKLITSDEMEEIPQSQLEAMHIAAE